MKILHLRNNYFKKIKKKNNEIKLFSFILLLKRKPSVDFENEANIKKSERVMVLIQIAEVLDTLKNEMSI